MPLNLATLSLLGANGNLLERPIEVLSVLGRADLSGHFDESLVTFGIGKLRFWC